MNVKPNIPCKVSKQSGYDKYGATLFGSAKNTKCLVVKLSAITDREIVRVDAGASRGNGKELKAEAVLLFDATVNIAQGDKVELLNFILQVVSVTPRFSTQGRHDHDEVELMIWQ